MLRVTWPQTCDLVRTLHLLQRVTLLTARMRIWHNTPGVDGATLYPATWWWWQLSYLHPLLINSLIWVSHLQNYQPLLPSDQEAMQWSRQNAAGLFCSWNVFNRSCTGEEMMSVLQGQVQSWLTSLHLFCSSNHYNCSCFVLWKKTMWFLKLKSACSPPLKLHAIKKDTILCIKFV